MKTDTIYSINEMNDTESITDLIEGMDDTEKKNVLILLKGVKIGRDLNKNMKG